MPLTPTQESMCNSLDQQFDAIVDPIAKAKSSYQRTLRDFRDQLSSISFSPQAQIDAALAGIRDAANAVMPGKEISDMNDIKDMIDNCSYFSAFSPVSSIISGATGMYNAIDDFINTAATSTPEFGLGALADRLVNMLGGGGIPGGNVLSDLFRQADELINCLSAICGRDVSIKIATLDALVGDFQLNDSYELDLETIYSDVGLSSTDITKMNTTIDGIKNIKTTASTAMNDTVSAIKELSKIGGFF
jgi:hypothetical protein